MQKALVFFVAVRDSLHTHILAGGLFKFLGRNERVFGAADFRQNRLVRQEAVFDIQKLLTFFHHALAVVGVVNREPIGKADAVCVAAQNPHTACVEGARPNVLRIFAEHAAEAFFQLVCRFISKGNRQNLPRFRGFGAKHIGNFRINRTVARKIGAHIRDIRVVGRAVGVIGSIGFAEAQKVRNSVDEHRGFAAARARKN